MVGGKSGRISDPVYGFIEFTDVERIILDQRVAQRLRFIAQSGLASFVFPEVCTSRFSHSLGAMHLASEFLTACLKNADGATRNDACRALRESVRKSIGETTDIDMACAGLASHVLLAHHHCPREEQKFVLFAEQALRLAALFHDIGHLPYSHDFEFAIEDFIELLEDPSEKARLWPLLEQSAGRTKLHERLGYNVARLMLRELSSDKTVSDSLNHPFNFAFEILVAVPTLDPTPGEAAIQWLHSLMSGDLDVDRCDYLLRDGRNYGFEFATYNLPRLLDNLVVAKKQRSFVSAVRPQGLSSLESFLLARFRSYQYGVRHHKVSQLASALRRSILLLLQDRANEEVQLFLGNLGELAEAGSGKETDGEKGRSLLSEFTKYDDIWWTSIMRAESVTRPENEWLGLVCWRQRGIHSLWKRSTDFSALLGNLRDSGEDSGLLDSCGEGEALVACWNSALPNPDNPDALKPWDDAVSALKSKDVFVIKHRFSPWDIDPESGESVLNVCTNDGRLIPVSTLSPLVRVLREAWLDDVQVQAFASSASPIGALDVLKALTEILAKEGREL